MLFKIGSPAGDPRAMPLCYVLELDHDEYRVDKSVRGSREKKDEDKNNNKEREEKLWEKKKMVVERR